MAKQVRAKEWLEAVEERLDRVEELQGDTESEAKAEKYDDELEALEELKAALEEFISAREST